MSKNRRMANSPLREKCWLVSCPRNRPVTRCALKGRRRRGRKRGLVASVTRTPNVTLWQGGDFGYLTPANPGEPCLKSLAGMAAQQELRPTGGVLPNSKLRTSNSEHYDTKNTLSVPVVDQRQGSAVRIWKEI